MVTILENLKEAGYSEQDINTMIDEIFKRRENNGRV